MKTRLFFLFTIVFYSGIVQAQEALLSSITQSYNGSDWINIYGVNYSYDASGNLTSETELNWYGSDWQNSSKTNYTYNANNMLVELIFQQWNTTKNEFENSSRDVYTYNTNGNIQEIISYSWNDPQWTTDDKTTAYYSNNNISHTIFSNWDGSTYVNDEKTILVFSNGNLTESLEQDWNTTTLAWEDSGRDTFTYNTSINRMTSNRGEIWENGAWVLVYQTDYETDTNGNRIKETDYWNGNLQSTTDYVYDTTILLSSFSHPFKDKSGVDYTFEDFPYVNKILTTTQNQSSGSIKTTYNYETSITLSVEQQSQANNTIKLFPNPVLETFEIEGIKHTQKIYIYNALGKKVLEQYINKNAKINTENLASGIYFLRFKAGKTLKFVKK